MATESLVIHSVGDMKRVEFPIGHVLYESREGLGNVRFSPKGDLIAVNDSGSVDGAGSLLLLDPKGSRKPRALWGDIGPLRLVSDGR